MSAYCGLEAYSEVIISVFIHVDIKYCQVDIVYVGEMRMVKMRCYV